MVVQKLTLEAAQVGEVLDFEVFGAIEEVWEIEVGDIVANHDVWIDFADKVAPSRKHLALLLER